jgi:transcriptional/translational regulatory protein YebC/TACO1
MNSTLALLLSKKKDYLEYQQKCEDTRNERQIIADEKIEKLFENFDLEGIVNNPDFKEDSVREVIILPILKELGYTHEQRESIEKLIEKLEEDEDVQNVFHNMKEDENGDEE